MNAQELLAALPHFTGTEQWYYLPQFGRRYTYTDGIKFLAENAGAYWMIDYVLARQPFFENKRASFQVWKFRKDEDDGFTFTVEDGNGNKLAQYTELYTDFPLDEFEFWVVNNVILLKSEY